MTKLQRIKILIAYSMAGLAIVSFIVRPSGFWHGIFIGFSLVMAINAIIDIKES